MKKAEGNRKISASEEKKYFLNYSLVPDNPFYSTYSDINRSERERLVYANSSFISDKVSLEMTLWLSSCMSAFTRLSSSGWNVLLQAWLLMSVSTLLVGFFDDTAPIIEGEQTGKGHPHFSCTDISQVCD